MVRILQSPLWSEQLFTHKVSLRIMLKNILMNTLNQKKGT